MNRTVLEKPFAPGQIRQRKGRNGVLDYVEGHSVIARLNEAFEGAWSFEVAWHEIREDEVLVLGRLTADGIVKTQFGASAVTRDRETRAALSLGDDLKAAATDALKKCATFLGVGLHLYAEKPLRPDAGRSHRVRRAPEVAHLPALDERLPVEPRVDEHGAPVVAFQQPHHHRDVRPARAIGAGDEAGDLEVGDRAEPDGEGLVGGCALQQREHRDDDGGA